MRKARVTKALAILVAASTTAFAVTPARACSCVRQTTPAAYVAQAGAIFEGVASKIEVIYRRGTDGRIFWPNEAIRSTIHVTRVYKGVVPKIVVLHSYVGGSLCGWQPAGVGRRQLFVARVAKRRYRTSSCTMAPLDGRASTNPYARHIRALPSRAPK